MNQLLQDSQKDREAIRKRWRKERWRPDHPQALKKDTTIDSQTIRKRLRKTDDGQTIRKRLRKTDWPQLTPLFSQYPKELDKRQWPIITPYLYLLPHH